MMRLILFAALALLVVPAIAQIPTSETEFSYQTYAAENVVTIGPKKMGNGSILMAYTYRYKLPPHEFYDGFDVVVYNPDGSVRWKFTKGGQPGDIATLHSVTPDLYGNLYVNYTGQYDGRRIVKLSAFTGQPLWDSQDYWGGGVFAGLADGTLVRAVSYSTTQNLIERFDTNGSSFDTDYVSGYGPRQILQDSTGNFFLTSSDYTDGWNLTKVSGELGQLWSKNYDDTPDGPVPAEPEQLSQSSSAMFIGASKSYNSYDDDLVLYRIDPANGDPQWTAAYNSSENGSDQVVTTVFAPDGRIAVLGRTSVGAFSGTTFMSVAMFSPTGALLWARELKSPLSTGSTIPSAGVFDADGNLYVAGYIDLSGTRGDAFVIKYDTLGIGRWFYAYNNIGNGRDEARGIDVLPNGDVELFLIRRPSLTYSGARISLKQISASLNQSSVTGGNKVKLTVTINSAAPTDLTFTISESSAAFSVPSTVTIPAGSLSSSVDVLTSAVQMDSTDPIKVTYASTSITNNLTVKAPILNTLNLSLPSVQGGTNVTATVSLTGKAPTGGVTVNLYEATVYADINPTLFFSKDDQTKTVTVVTKPVASDQTVTVIATLNGSARVRTLTITKPILNSLSVSNLTYTGGASVPLTVWLSGNAPNNYTVALSDNHAAAITPANVVFSQNSPSAVATVTTTPVTTNTPVTFTATLNGVTKTKEVTLIPPALSVLTVTPTVVFGGHPTTGIVFLNQPAPSGGVVVTLSSNNSSKVTVPANVTIPAGANSMSFMILTNSVTTQTTVQVRATAASKTVTTNVVLLPL